jgi:hypothetical protein
VFPSWLPLNNAVLLGAHDSRSVDVTVSALACLPVDFLRSDAAVPASIAAVAGFGRTLMEHVLADAKARGATTATLQSTRMGQTLYESLGFTAAGRYEEWSQVIHRLQS